MTDSVVLLSGGLDSAVALYHECHLGRRAIGLFVDYGQRNYAERVAAARVAEHCGVDLLEASVQLPFDRSPLLDHRILATRTLDEIRSMPSPMYVPGRNAMLLSLAASVAEHRGAQRVVIGCNADDARFEDCTGAFLIAMEDAFNCLRKPLAISAPLLGRSKRQVAELSVAYGVPATFSCYSPSTDASAYHCGRCDACQLRRDAFEGLEDPTLWTADL